MRQSFTRREILAVLGALGGCVPVGRAAAPGSTPMQPKLSQAQPPRAVIRSIRNAGDSIEVEIESATEFPVQNELPTLRLGNFESRLSRYKDTGDPHTLIFSYSSADFAAIPNGVDAMIYYGDPADLRRWNCGQLDKRLSPLP